jgi:DNA polymerase
MKLTIDFESRSTVDLFKTNAWVYAEHPDTQIMCCAFKVDNDLPALWVPATISGLYDIAALDAEKSFYFEHYLEPILGMLDEAEIIEAHNLEFEIALWTCKMVPLGFPDLREEPYFSKLRCSASVCNQKALPRALGKVCLALGTENQKDVAGHKLMLKMCKPRSPRKAEKAADLDWESKIWYHETPEMLLDQARYCAQDVNTENEVSTVVGHLPPSELEVWRLDQKANWRGVKVDTDLARKMIVIREEYGVELRAEFEAITGFSVTQVTQFAQWLQPRVGVPVPSVDKTAITELLSHPITTPDTRRALEIRQEYAKTSLKKLDAAVLRTNADGRMRSTLMYHGASTGRWTGKGMQLQNLPSRGLIPDIEQCSEFIRMGVDALTLASLYPDLQLALSSCIRSLLTASEGKTLYAADFSSIEGRVLAWLADDLHVIKQYIDKVDLYKVAASLVYHVSYEEVTKAQRTVGKIPELAGGFGGGWRAYMTFAKTYQLSPPESIYDSLTDEDFKDWMGKALSGEEAAYMKWFDPMVKAWRGNRPGTVRLWYELEYCAKQAILQPGEVVGRKEDQFEYKGQMFNHTGILFGVSKRFLQILLPSGRKLYYFDPKMTERGGKNQVSYMCTDSMKGGAWLRQYTYGGKLCENVVQAIARDLMAEAQVRIDKADIGLDLLFTVHDEIINEGAPGIITLSEYEAMMAESPDWAIGCPIGAEGWVGTYYRKD